MLGGKMAATGSNVWLVNTGWTGGAYGTCARMKIAYTRAMVRAALDGRLGGIGVARHPQFGLLMPESCPDVPPEVLNPRNTWRDKNAYDRSEEHTSELQSLMRISYAVFCLKKKKKMNTLKYKTCKA